MPQAREKTTLSQVKVPPHNIEAEQAILAGILINNDSLNQIVDILFSDDFYRELYSGEGDPDLRGEGSRAPRHAFGEHQGRRGLQQEIP